MAKHPLRSLSGQWPWDFKADRHAPLTFSPSAIYFMDAEMECYHCHAMMRICPRKQKGRSHMTIILCRTCRKKNIVEVPAIGKAEMSGEAVI